MTTSTLSLTEFLLARIAEDEAGAKLRQKRAGAIPPHEAEAARVSAAAFGQSFLVIGANDPSRVLAECKAKRAIVESTWGDHLRIEGEWGLCRGQDALEAEHDYPEAVVALAAIYAWHEDYRAEWAS